MKIFFYSLFFLLVINTMLFGYDFTITPNSLDFGPIAANQAWSEDITHPSWYQSSTISVYISFSGNEITNSTVVKIYSSFINKNWPNYPTDSQKIAVLNSINTNVNGLFGLINFETANTANVYDSYLPVRLKISYQNVDTDNFAGQYTTSENDKWIWLKDKTFVNFTTSDNEYANFWTAKALVGKPSLHYCQALLKVSIPISKAWGSYKGLLQFSADTQ